MGTNSNPPIPLLREDIRFLGAAAGRCGALAGLMYVQGRGHRQWWLYLALPHRGPDHLPRKGQLLSFVVFYHLRGWSCSMFSHSPCCLEHAVQCCPVQGDQSPSLETQKTSQQSKLPFSTRAGSEQTYSLGLFCFLSSGIA